MTWSYDPTALSTSPLDQVRFELGDTSEATPQLQDEEIQYLLGQVNNDVLLAAYHAARNVSAKMGTKASRTVGSLSISYAEQRDAFTKLANQLRIRCATGLPIAGGYISLGGGIILAAPDQDNIRRDTNPNPLTPGW